MKANWRITGDGLGRPPAPVVPGDQLHMTVEAVRIRSRTAEIHGVARVGDAVAAEARIRFVLVEDRR